MICVSSTVMPLTCQPFRVKDAFRYTAGKILFFPTHSKFIKERHTLWSTCTWQKNMSAWEIRFVYDAVFKQCNRDFAPPSGCCHFVILQNECFSFSTTRPKTPIGRQGLVGLSYVSGWIHFSIFATFFLHFCNMFHLLYTEAQRNSFG